MVPVADVSAVPSEPALVTAPGMVDVSSTLPQLTSGGNGHP